MDPVSLSKIETDLLASLGSKGKNRNSLACLRNAGFYSAVTYCSSPSKVKKNLSSPSSQELVPLTLESVYGTLLTHSSLFSQSDRHRILHFEFRVVLNFSDMTS